MPPVPFVKMYGLGNDFVVIDTRSGVPAPERKHIAPLCDRRYGVGCDQLVVMERGEDVDCRVLFYNADGSPSGACGNGTRCVAYLLMEKSGKDSCVMEIGGKRVAASRDAAGDPRMISVDMGVPSFRWQDVPLSHECDTLHVKAEEGLPDAVAVSVGNPHLVFFTDDADVPDLASIGPRLERSPLLPERGNIHFAAVVGRQEIVLRTWERGAGMTLACGTGACAAAAAAEKRGLAEGRIAVHMRGGTVHITLTSEGRMTMEGPTAVSFRGTADAEGL